MAKCKTLAWPAKIKFPMLAAAGCVPKYCCAILGNRGDQPAIRAIGHIADRIGVARKRTHFGTDFRIPDTRCIVPRTGDDIFSVG